MVHELALGQVWIALDGGVEYTITGMEGGMVYLKVAHLNTPQEKTFYVDDFRDKFIPKIVRGASWHNHDRESPLYGYFWVNAVFHNRVFGWLNNQYRSIPIVDFRAKFQMHTAIRCCPVDSATQHDIVVGDRWVSHNAQVVQRIVRTTTDSVTLENINTHEQVANHSKHSLRCFYRPVLTLGSYWACVSGDNRGKIFQMHRVEDGKIWGQSLEGTPWSFASEKEALGVLRRVDHGYYHPPLPSGSVNAQLGPEVAMAVANTTDIKKTNVTTLPEAARLKQEWKDHRNGRRFVVKGIAEDPNGARWVHVRYEDGTRDMLIETVLLSSAYEFISGPTTKETYNEMRVRIRDSLLFFGPPRGEVCSEDNWFKAVHFKIESLSQYNATTEALTDWLSLRPLDDETMRAMMLRHYFEHAKATKQRA